METSNKQDNSDSQVVTDRAKSSISDLWKKEDYWAIWLGFSLLIMGCILFLPNPPKQMETKIQLANETLEREAARAPFKTIEYYEAQDIKFGRSIVCRRHDQDDPKYTHRCHRLCNRRLLEHES